MGIWIGTGGRAESARYAIDGALKIGAKTVHLVDEADAGYVVAVRLAPYRLGLRLDARHRVEDDDPAVQDAKAPLDLSREVHVPRGVYDVYGVAVPPAGRRGRRDRNAPFPLLGHPVHRRGALVHAAYLVDAAGYVEGALGYGRLARVYVGDEPDVSRFFQPGLRIHDKRIAVSRAERPRPSPPVVDERSVRLSHTVKVLLSLDGGPLGA